MPLAIMFYFILAALAAAVIVGACAAVAAKSLAGVRVMEALNVAVIVLFFLLWLVLYLESRG